MDIIKALKEKNQLNFNEEQLEILNHRIGPAIVHSTAGSGKTTIICGKIAILINDYDVLPEQILVLSYSNASVDDIASRHKELMTGKIHSGISSKVKFSTIHAFGMSVIYYYSYKTGIKYKIAGVSGQDSVNSIISKIFQETYQREPQLSELNRIVNSISLLNNEVEKDINNLESSKVDNLIYIYKKYNQYKQEKGIIDFDDMIILSKRLLEENLALREYFQNKYEYVLVDEVQDMSKIQYEFLKLIVNKSQNIVAFGDSDQSIYSFRGSYKNIFLDFNKDFHSIKKFNLGINYRCSVNIVDVSSRFIGLDTQRLSKEINSFKKDNGLITIASFKNDEEQIEFVMNEIINKYSDELDETIILFRDSLSLLKPVCKFYNKGMDFYCNTSDYSFFKHFTKNDIVASIWLSYDRTLLIALFQFYNKINLNLDKGDIYKLRDNQLPNESIFDCFKRLGGFTNEKRKLMEDLEQDLNHLGKLKPSEAIDYLLEEMNYREYLNKLTKEVGYEKSIYFRYIEIMRYLTRNEPSIRTYIDWVARLQQRVQQSVNNKGKKAVSLSTLHSAKGLEYNNVFIIDTNEGIIPSYIGNAESSLYDRKNLEEERRLMFVGMTRAKKNLYVLSSGPKSQYVAEMESILEDNYNNMEK